MTTTPTSDLARTLALSVRDLELAAGNLLRSVEANGDDLPILTLARALVKLDELHGHLCQVRDDLEAAALGEPVAEG
jgi:hypothetical protein